MRKLVPLLLLLPVALDSAQGAAREILIDGEHDGLVDAPIGVSM